MCCSLSALSLLNVIRHFTAGFQNQQQQTESILLSVTVAKTQKQAHCREKSFPPGVFIIGEWAKRFVLPHNALFRNKHLLRIGR